MATGRLPDPNTAPLTAKGDLYTYSTVPAKLAVGSNGDTLVADSSATTGLRWQGDFAAGKNKIINGDFGIWQRGTSFNHAAGAFSADRFWQEAATAVPTGTVSRQSFTAGTAPVAGYESAFFARINITANNGCTAYTFDQKIEDVRTLAGQSVTISFWAKADAATTLPIELNQHFGSGGSATVTTAFGTASLTTSWTRFSYTATVPSISGKTIGSNSYLRCVFILPLSAGVVRNGTYDIWGLQVESGSVATAFQTASGSLQGELALAQRYYWRSADASAYGGHAVGICYATTGFDGFVPFPVQMRIAPSSVEYSTLVVNDGDSNEAVTALTIAQKTSKAANINATVAAGLTQYRPGFLLNNNNTAGYIGFSAEF